MVLKIFTFWRLGLFFVAYLSTVAVVKIANGGPGATGPNAAFNFWQSWAQWDGGHFLGIIQNSYRVASDSAFFPLYPLLAKLFSIFLFGNKILSGLLISNASFLLFLYVLHRFISLQRSQKIARNAIFAYIFYPAAFFAVSFYSEGLYLLLSTLAFLFFYQKKYSRAFLWVALAAITRPFGILLAIALLAAYTMQSIKLKKLKTALNLSKYFLISSVPVILYLGFLLIKFRSAFSFFSVQTLWGREAADPLSTVSNYLIPLLSLQVRPVVDYIDVFTFMSFLLILIFGARKLTPSLWIYSMLTILIPASTGTLSSIPRYALSAIGVFILIGDYLTYHPKSKTIIFTVFLLLQVFLLARFINGYWAG